MIFIKELSFTYPKSSMAAVQAISFEVQKGEIFGFLGPSGAGKSTTQKILTGLLKGYQGRVSVNGFDVPGGSASFFQNIGVGFELPNHYPRLTAMENLNFFRSFYEKECEDPLELLDRVGLLPHAHQRVSEFSKGMKMRLNFVRALLHKPEILFLDEPTSGLDPFNARILKNIILDYKQKGKTVFLTTHNMHDADELCDHVAFMVQGKIALIDSPKNLKQQYGQRVLSVEYEDSGIKCLDFNMDQLSENAAFQNIIKSHYVRSMHSKEASLEDIFITSTGQQLNS